MRKSIFRKLFYPCCLIICICFNTHSNPDVGYFYFKKGGAMVHAYVPEHYSPDKNYPFLLALHGESGYGQSLMPFIQIHAEKYGFIVVCPDAKGFSWGGDLVQNQLLLKRVYRHFARKYRLHPDRQFILGLGEGGKFIMFLISHKASTPNLSDQMMRNFSGCIIIEAEAELEFQNEIWEMKNPDHPSFSREMVFPILYYQPKLSSLSNYLRARWTKKYLKRHKFPVHYVETNAPSGYPIQFNDRIFEWCTNRKESKDEIEETQKKESLYVVPDFKIYHFGVIHKENVSDYMLKKWSDNFNVDCNPGAKTSRAAVEKSGRYRTIYSTTFNCGSQPTDEKVLKNVRVIFFAFDKQKQLTYTNEARFFGLDEGTKTFRDYIREHYSLPLQESDRQLDVQLSLKPGQTASASFPVPFDRECPYASVLIFQNTKLVGFKMYPENIDHLEFQELAHIVLPQNEPKGIKEKPLPKTSKTESETEIRDEKAGYFRVVE